MVKKLFSINDVLNNFCLWERCAKICTMGNGKFIISDFEKKLNELKSGSYFVSIINILEKNNYIIIDKSRIPFIYEIKYKELSNFLLEDSGNIPDLFEKIVKIKSSNRYKY